MLNLNIFIADFGSHSHSLTALSVSNISLHCDLAIHGNIGAWRVFDLNKAFLVCILWNILTTNGFCRLGLEYVFNIQIFNCHWPMLSHDWNIDFKFITVIISI